MPGRMKRATLAAETEVAMSESKRPQSRCRSSVRAACAAVVAVICGAALGGGAAASAPAFLVVDLGSFGGEVATATAVNGSGQVVGYSFNPLLTRALSWTPAGGLVDLGTLADPLVGTYGSQAS